MPQYFLNAWHTTLELAPWLLLGALVAGLLHVLLPANFVERQLTGRWSVLKAVALGVPLPLCSCGVIPMAVGLHRQRASRGATVGFLISTPQTGVDSILVSAAMLGWPFALFKVIAALATGVVGGGITNLLDGDNAALPVVASSHDTDNSCRSLSAMARHTLEILHSIWGWLVIGVVVSALISTYVPDTAFVSLAAYGGLAAMGVALGISLPLYVCATASVPIAAALVASGLPTGAALVFLMAGPATNLATIGAVHRTLGSRSLVVYLTTIIAGSVLAGLLFDTLIPPASGNVDPPQHDSKGWQIASALVLIALVLWFAASDLWRKFRRQPASCCE
ncbi:MAG: permease [Aeoliella sp.]